jgi:hypothetical protein
VFSQPAPEAVDPFSEQFAEEELVLDSFATLASIFGTRTPRVENGREPGFSRLVQHALDATTAAAEREELSANEESDEAEQDRDLTRTMIRLAIVSDSPSVAVDETPIEPESISGQHFPAATLAPQPNDDADDTILVIEDEPAPTPGPQPGVRREGYRQLFSRLRHGT